jgi:hypothetical protein
MRGSRFRSDEREAFTRRRAASPRREKSHSPSKPPVARDASRAARDASRAARDTSRADPRRDSRILATRFAQQFAVARPVPERETPGAPDVGPVSRGRTPRRPRRAATADRAVRIARAGQPSARPRARAVEPARRPWRRAELRAAYGRLVHRPGTSFRVDVRHKPSVPRLDQPMCSGFPAPSPRWGRRKLGTQIRAEVLERRTVWNAPQRAEASSVRLAEVRTDNLNPGGGLPARPGERADAPAPMKEPPRMPIVMSARSGHSGSAIGACRDQHDRIGSAASGGDWNRFQ